MFKLNVPFSFIKLRLGNFPNIEFSSKSNSRLVDVLMFDVRDISKTAITQHISICQCCKVNKLNVNFEQTAESDKSSTKVNLE